jgi:NAD(P)-dependent dehydrogenase (short-subunit alcohol dehydrogenase family)
MKEFKGKTAVITGTGTGMGRELAVQLVSEGCNVAICDLNLENLKETEQVCKELAPLGTRVTAHECDVSDETQVMTFCDAVKNQHQIDHINLLINNAGIGGGQSFVLDDRSEWDRVFAINWFGVYYCIRAFMPLLLASHEGHIVNISSVNGFWACLGASTTHTAYSTSKFAVKGFTESLMVDLRSNAPHIKISLVMPGHIGTSLMINSTRVLEIPDPADMSKEDLVILLDSLNQTEIPAQDMDDNQLVETMNQIREGFRDNAPVSAVQAASVILDGVRNEKWRILIGDDAYLLDSLVRQSPENAYDSSIMEKFRAAETDDSKNLGTLFTQFEPDNN